MSLSDQILDWMLRRRRQGVALHHDLVLVSDHPSLAEAGAELLTGGERWRVARVGGELTLRAALPDGDGRVIAIIPHAMLLPPDLSGRSYMGRALEVRAEDVVAALAGRFCEPLHDETLSRSVMEAMDTLRDVAGRWSLSGVVTAREVRAVLIAAELGADERLDRESDSALLARWIVRGRPTFRAPSLLTEALTEAHGRAGAWLAWAATIGSVESLLAAGALFGTDACAALAPEVPEVTGAADRQRLRNLVESAVRTAYAKSPDSALAALGEAERLGHRAQLEAEDAARHPLLRAALDRALHVHARAAADGNPAADAVIEALGGNLHAPRASTQIALVRDLARLARFCFQVPALPEDAPAMDWLRLARASVAFADWCIRRVRRMAADAPEDLRSPAGSLLERAVAHRDVLNAGFAQALARDWQNVCAARDMAAPLPAHQITRFAVRRLLDAGRRVLLLVLDGCDLSTFLELVDTLPDDLGLQRPEVADAVVRDDLDRATAFTVAVAPVPTVTSHARRALFAGEIPGNTALNDTEAPAANASADKVAFQRNTALGDVPRKLFLKGDLGPASANLLEALRSEDAPLVAAVFNGVDDALSSKETTPLGPWSLAALGAGAQEVIRCAIEMGRVVLVTADHGHTPHIAAERKAGASAAGTRFDSSPAHASVAFDQGPLPSRPLHLLTNVGGWYGTQRRGYHGGAGMEEVAVPLAFLGSVPCGAGRPVPPAWWWTSAPSEAPPPPMAKPTSAVAPRAPVVEEPAGPVLPVDVRSMFAPDSRQRRALELLVEKEALTPVQLGRALGIPAPLVRGLMGRILADIARAGLRPLFLQEGEGEQVLYRSLSKERM